MSYYNLSSIKWVNLIYTFIMYVHCGLISYESYTVHIVQCSNLHYNWLRRTRKNQIKLKKFIQVNNFNQLQAFKILLFFWSIFKQIFSRTFFLLQNFDFSSTTKKLITSNDLIQLPKYVQCALHTYCRFT